MTKKLLALYGLKWNPFAPDVPVEALHVSRRIESFCWRAEQLVGEGGFALVTGAPGRVGYPQGQEEISISAGRRDGQRRTESRMEGASPAGVPRTPPAYRRRA